MAEMMDFLSTFWLWQMRAFVISLYVTPPSIVAGILLGEYDWRAHCR